MLRFKLTYHHMSSLSLQVSGDWWAAWEQLARPHNVQLAHWTTSHICFIETSTTQICHKSSKTSRNRCIHITLMIHFINVVVFVPITNSGLCCMHRMQCHLKRSLRLWVVDSGIAWRRRQRHVKLRGIWAYPRGVLLHLVLVAMGTVSMAAPEAALAELVAVALLAPIAETHHTLAPAVRTFHRMEDWRIKTATKRRHRS